MLLSSDSHVSTKAALTPSLGLDGCVGSCTYAGGARRISAFTYQCRCGDFGDGDGRFVDSGLCDERLHCDELLENTIEDLNESDDVMNYLNAFDGLKKVNVTKPPGAGKIL